MHRDKCNLQAVRARRAANFVEIWKSMSALMHFYGAGRSRKRFTAPPRGHCWDHMRNYQNPDLMLVMIIIK